MEENCITEIGPGEGMDRTYRNKFLQGVRAEFSAPIFPASKVRNEAEKKNEAAAGSCHFHLGTERMGFRAFGHLRYRAVFVRGLRPKFGWPTRNLA